MQLEDIKKVAIFRALFLGDLLCTVPFFRSLRKASPKARISLIGLPWTKEFVPRFSKYIDELIEFPGYPGLSEQMTTPSAVKKFLKTMREEDFDLVFQIHGNGTIVNQIIKLWGAKHTAGFYPGGQTPPNPLFLEYPEKEHETRKLLKLLTHLGIETDGEHLEYPVFPKEENLFENEWSRWGINPPYAVIHPGAKNPMKRWPAQNFAKAADKLASSGVQIILTGTTEEKDLTKEVATLMKNPAVNLTGLTSLGSLGLLIKNAKLLLANDTSVSHIATAFKTPSLIASHLKDPSAWAPLDQNLHNPLI